MLTEKRESALNICRSRFLVIPLGLEPKTHSLEGCCSIQLSYGTGTAKIIIFCYTAL